MNNAFERFRQMRPMALFSGCALMCFLGVGTAKADFVNGNFGTGDLTGWTVFTTANGNNGSGLPAVVSFDTTGTGASNSAEFEVGENTFTGNQEGGGLEQALTLGPGSYTITAAVAAEDPGGNNVSAGLFQILEDGSSIGSVDFGYIGTNQTLRGTLTASFNLATGGTHTFGIEITRPFNNQPGGTPYEYVTNVTLGGTSVPEPSAILPLMGVMAAVSLRFRRRRC